MVLSLVGDRIGFEFVGGISASVNSEVQQFWDILYIL